MMTIQDKKELLPEGWKKTVLGKECIIKTGKKDVNEGNPEGDYPFFTCSRDFTFSENYSFDTEALLIAGNGDVGTLHYYKGKFEAYQRTYVLDRFKTDIFYVYQYLDSRLIQSLLVDKVGTSIPYIKLNNLTDFELILPDNIEEQQKISEILIMCEEVIEETAAKIEKLKKIKQGLMQDLFRYGIDEHGQIRSKVTHHFKDSPVGEIPKEWEIKSVFDLLTDGIIEDVQDGNHGELHPKASDFVDQGVPFIMATDIANNKIDFDNCKKITPEQYLKLRIGFAKPGDVLLSHKASIGFTVIVPNDCQEIMLTPQVTYYRIKNLEKLSNKYLMFYFQTNLFQRMLENFAKQSTRNYIGILAQRNLVIIYPIKIEEQYRIVSILSAADEAIEREEAYKNKFLGLKTGLMKDLLSGTVRVNNLIGQTT